MVVGLLIVKIEYEVNEMMLIPIYIACQIDWFVLSYVDYLWLELEEKVTVRYADDCQLKNYVNKHHLASVKATANEKVIPSLLNAKYQK